MKFNLVPVSGIIPTNSRSEILKRTLLSVGLQSCLPTELIIVDASTNNHTKDLCEEIENSFSFKIVHIKAKTSGAVNILADVRIKEVGICLEWNPSALLDAGSDKDALFKQLSDYRFFYLNDYEGQKLPELAEVKDPRNIDHVCNLFAIHKQSAKTEPWKEKFVMLKNHYGVKVG